MLCTICMCVSSRCSHLVVLHSQCSPLHYECVCLSTCTCSWKLCSSCMSQNMLMVTSKAQTSSLASIHHTSTRYMYVQHCILRCALYSKCLIILSLICYHNILQVYLVDYGLACRYRPQQQHKEYKEDPRRKHDGTLEFTSIDAHKGVSECIVHVKTTVLCCVVVIYDVAFWANV